MAGEDWSRFLPTFKKKNTSKRRKPLVVREKKAYTPFPPAPVPSKVDLQLDSGEYFLNEAQREAKKKAEKKAAAKAKSDQIRAEKEKEYEPPVDDVKPSKRSRDDSSAAGEEKKSKKSKKA